jgi:tripartite-type tricarboxylate transporter receptor subunit TctC
MPKGRKMKAIVLIAAALTTLTAPVVSRAQRAYPAKPVHFVVAFAPGGIVDVVARLIAPRLAEVWGQPAVVENRAGAGGLLGTIAALRSAPDGYTVLVHGTAVAVTPYLSPNAGYKLERDLVPVIEVASSPNMILAYPGLGAVTLQQAVDKARPGKLNYSSPGPGTPPHLSAEYLFKSLARVNVTHVPYQAVGQAVAAGIAGDVQFVSITAASARSHVKSGKLRALAVMSSRRVATMPEVPTVAEAGFPAFEDYTWVGVFLPAGSPQEPVARLNADIEQLLATQDLRERLAALGFDPVGGSPAQFAAYLKRESAKWARVVKETGAKAD